MGAMGATPLYIASNAGFKELAAVLIEGGAHINKLVRTFGGCYTALMIACINNHLDVVELLLEKGADANIQGAEFPLHWACENNNMEMVRLLVKYGADVHVKRKYGNSLAYARSLEIVQFLIDHGADVNARGETSNALVKASEKDHLNIVRVLIEHGADVNAKGMKVEHGNALFAASSEGNYDIVKLLLESGADANSEEPPLNALQAARKAEWDEVTALLLHYGARRR
jgi:ankyrin repeat protein